MKPSRPTIFLDTSALISLVDETRPHHAAMVAFYDAWTQEGCEVRVVFSAIVLAEYEAMADFPQQLQFYFDVEAFGHTRYFALPYDALEAFGDAPILLRPRALTDVSLEAQ